MRKYKVVGCPSCHNWQITTATKQTRCRFCNKSINMLKTKVWVETGNARLARLITQKLNTLETHQPEIITTLITRIIRTTRKD